MKASQTSQVQTERQGPVDDESMRTAVAKVRSALRPAGEPVLFARVRLTVATDPALERPAIAQVNVDLNGRLVRAQAVAETMAEAIDRMHHRLRVRLQRAGRDWESIRGRRPSPAPHEWRHESPHAHQPPYFPRPLEERTVVRRKSYALQAHSPEEAVAEMELLDYDFHLFTERATGEDSVVYRSDDGYRLALARPRYGRLGPFDAAISISRFPAPTMELPDAIASLEALGRPFLFFIEPATGRGNLIYHRYDGHYGLVEPA